MSTLERRHVVIGEHFYQPPRKATHARVADISTDPDNIDWNKRIANECYIPQTSRGTLNQASFDFYATIRQEMGSIAPQESAKLREAMHVRGVGDPFLHVLLPDLDTRDKDILIKAGKVAFEQEAGIAPQWLWVPETALDLDVLRVAKLNGYTGVLCAPEQFATYDLDSRPVKVELPGYGQILALPFDRPFSSSLAFDSKTDADRYTNEVILPRLLRLPMSVPLVGWTDGETFGHHAKFADLFLHYLVTHSLGNVGVSMLGVNQLTDVWEESDYVSGTLRERTAWSCPHGDLVRWHGACPCDGGHNGEWKAHFYSALQEFNHEVSQILDSQLNEDWPLQLSEHFGDAFAYEGGANTEHSLLAAKASSLAAQTSCGTFFDNPITSGRINVVFVLQALEHLRDAQLSSLADGLEKNLRTSFARGVDPHTGDNLEAIFADTLSDQQLA